MRKKKFVGLRSKVWTKILDVLKSQNASWNFFLRKSSNHDKYKNREDARSYTVLPGTKKNLHHNVVFRLH